MDVKFGENTTLQNLNPLNFALKNEYADNLLSTALLIIPKVEEYHKVEVITGFIAKAHLASTFRINEHNRWLRQHTVGLALQFTWDKFDMQDALKIANVLAETIIEPIYVIVDGTNRKLCVIRGYLKDVTKIDSSIDDYIREVKIIKVS